MRFSVVFAIPGALAVVLSACDPVHDDAVSALGPEANGERPGPTHRRGQPCLVCHGGSGPAGGSADFSVGGTVYKVQGGTDPLEGATVKIVDSGNHIYRLKTNSVGNFYLSTADGLIQYPASVEVSYGKLVATMNTHIGRDGSCASCHTKTPSQSSAGPVYVALQASDLPSAP